MHGTLKTPQAQNLATPGSATEQPNLIDRVTETIEQIIVPGS
nr:hypothetical protein [Chamaesiphon minutus]